jgi:glycosyltransferase involved in cell wall biosynthesis
MAAGGPRTHSRGAGIVIDPARPDYRNTPGSTRRPQHPFENGYGAAPQVSIVTPFFNTGPVFHETARSVLAQSLPSWEWLIVNDGSTAPESLHILDTYRRADPRIRILDLPENLGPSSARNAGCRAATTSYLLLLDSDDLLEPTAAEKWWWFLESYPEFGFVKGFSVGFGAMEYLATSGFHEAQAFLESNRVDITSLVRADVLRAAGGFPEGNRHGLEDWEFWLRCARAGFWGGTVPEYLSWYRRRDDDARRWPNWQGDRGSGALRARLREEFRDLYENPARVPSPRPSQLLPDRTPERNPGLPWRPTPETRRRPALQGPGRTDANGVLLIVPWMTLGGADKFNLDLAAQLTRRGWRVSIAALCQGDQSWLAAFTEVTPDVFVLPDIVRLHDYPRFLSTLITTRAIDVVMVTNAELGYRLLPHLRAVCEDVAFVDFCHMEQEEWQHGGYPRFSIDSARSLDRSIVLSEHLRAWMLARGRRSDDLVVSHNGVHVPDEAHLAQQRALFRRRWSLGAIPVLVFAGRLVDQKQPHIFAEAVTRLWANNVDCAVVVAGDGPGLPGTRQRLEQHNGRTAIFLGAVPPDTLDGVLCGADILCLPSRWEGIALVVQEAMARGVAVVTADVGGQRELVTADCGVLIPPGDDEVLISAYADRLQRLILNPEGRRRMGARARARIADAFTLDQMGERMDGILRQTHRRAPGVATADASEVVESMQSQYVPYFEWVQTVVAGRIQPAASWNRRVFRSLTLLEPLYRWGIRRGWTWLPAMRRALRGRVRRLLRLDG